MLISHWGEGARFRFTFTAQPARAADASPQVLRLAPDRPTPRVLVVDDDPASRQMLASLLGSVGFAAEMVSSAPEALGRLHADAAFDVVLMDKRMPEMDGLEAVRRMRELPGGRELAVLIVSASSLGNERAAALAAGANGYVAKPVRREELLAEIGRLAGVRYEFWPDSPSTDPAAAVAPAAPAERVRLSPEQSGVLDQALRRGDVRQLRKMVEELAFEQAGLAAEIRTLVEAYDYDGLRRLLEPASETTVPETAVTGT